MKKNLTMKVLLGFPIGVMLLMISYMAIYYVAGKAIYVEEIEKLENIGTFVRNELYAGFGFMVIIIAIEYIQQFRENGVEKKNSLGQDILMGLLPVTVVLLEVGIARVMNIGRNIEITYATICIVSIAIYGVIGFIGQIKDVKNFNKVVNNKKD